MTLQWKTAVSVKPKLTHKRFAPCYRNFLPGLCKVFTNCKYVHVIFCCFLLVLDQRSYATSLEKAGIPQVAECYCGFIEPKGDVIILIKMVVMCIF